MKIMLKKGVQRKRLYDPTQKSAIMFEGGEVYDVDDEVGAGWVEAGSVVKVTKPINGKKPKTNEAQG